MSMTKSSGLIRPAALRLPSEDIERHTTWLEIFFDLVFAVIVVQLSDGLAHHLTFSGILQSGALFIPSLWTWASYTVFAARFDNDDLLHWLMTFVIMFAGAIMAIQIPTALENGATGFSIGFLISQVSVLLLYSRTLFEKSAPKKITHFYMIGFGLGGVCWVISLFFPAPVKFIFWALGMSIYLLTPWVGRKRILSQAPLDTLYIPERFGAFTIIILGQIITSVVSGLEIAHWVPSSVITSIMAFALAVLIWGQYYRFTKIANYKCTLGSGQPYIYCHIPLIISLMLIGVCAQACISNTITSNIKNIFCFSLLLYLASFYLLQCTALTKYKIRGFIYLGGGVAVWGLFLLPLSPMLIMSGIATIFMALFVFQYLLDRKIPKIC